MAWKHFLKTNIQKSGQFLWFIQDFLRHGTFHPSIKSIQKNKKDRIFIIGNGPSLNQDIAPFIEDLKQEDVMMVNQALTHPLAFNLKPSYYTLMDPAYWGLYTQEEDIEEWITDCITSLNEKLASVDWQINILAPYHFYAKRTEKGIACTNQNIHIHTFNAAELYTFSSLQRWLYVNAFAIPSGINVLISALCCALIIGYNKIYLLGADSTWHTQLGVDKDNRVFSIEEHYYHDEVQKVYTPYRLSFHMQCITEAFKAYDTLGMTFPQIYNLSSSSMIDAFPRRNLADIFTGGRARVNLFWLFWLFLLSPDKRRAKC